MLELVEGETLAERLNKGPLPAEEALEICTQIAEALEAAHEKGVFHRDLKPGNLKITANGKVKVLDFRLAKELFFPALNGDLMAVTMNLNQSGSFRSKWLRFRSPAI